MTSFVKNSTSVLVIVLVLVLGTVAPGVAMFSDLGGQEYDEITGEKEVVVMTEVENPNELAELEKFGEVIDSYGGHALLRVDEKELRVLENERMIDHLEHRNELFVNGKQLDTREDSLDINKDMMIDDYDQETQGLYLIDLIGPINTEWREEIEEKGVDVMNYVPNYAYRVQMTPEIAEEISHLEYVDWVEPYHPEFKIQEGLEDGMVEIGMTDSAEMRSLEKIDRLSSSVKSAQSHDGDHRIITEVESEDILIEIARMPEVYYIREFIEPELHSEIDSQIVGGGLWNMDDEDGDHSDPYRKHGDYGAYINQIGYTGEGVTIAIADTGLGDGEIGDAGHPDLDDRVIGGYSFGSEEDEWQDGHYHGTHTAGLAAGDTYHGTGETYPGEETGPYYLAQGLAYESELFGTKIFDDSGGAMVPADTFEVVEEPAQRSDTYIHSNSWGADTMGEYFESDSSYDAAVRDSNRDTDENEPMVITSSAGNAGPNEQTTGSPGHAKNVITVGATETWIPDGTDYGGPNRENPDNVVGYSSRGWTADNRIKPDVVAPAELTISTQTPLGEGNYEPNEDKYRWMGGTSSSNPIVAGAAAVVVEWYEENYGTTPSPAMVRSLLINTAEPLDEENGNTGHIPNRDEGWGMVDLSKLEYPNDDPVEIFTEDQEDIFENSGEVHEYELDNDDPDEPLRITLGWTDKEAPVDTGGDPSLINDLNLEVISPGGHSYRGNAFEEGWTQPNQDTMEDFDRLDDGWDDTNNIQNVYLPSEELENGIYTVRVHASNIADDAVGIGENSQDYALTAYNAVEGETVGEPPSIDISYPEGGEIWTGHDDEVIEWNSSAGDDDLDRVNLFYSLDKGQSWDVIGEDIDPVQESFSWSVTNIPSEDVKIRARVVDEEGRSHEDVVEDIEIEGIPPKPPEHLLISHTDTANVPIFEDDVSEDKGYTTWTSHENASEWDIRDHGSSVGENSWDWGDMYFNKMTDEGMESRLTSPEIELPEDADDLELTFDHWRDFGDQSIDDGGNLKISTTGEDGDFEIIHPIDGYDGEIESYFGNPLGGEQGWGGTSDWETESFDLSEYGGETIHLRWDAGVEQLIELFPGIGQGWRIDNIEITGIFEEEDAHNQLRWYGSPDEDIQEVSHYDIHRSEERDGPWDEDTYINSVPADGSETYYYEDPFTGDEDDTHWWYVVRAVGTNSLKEENEEAKQEQGYPEVDHPEITIDQPDSEQTWYAHEEKQIEWTTDEGDEDIDYLELSYSLDAGETWSDIDGLLEDDGSFDWTVPNWPSEEAMIKGRVVDQAGRFTENTSEEYFEIIGQPPSPPENLEVNHADVEEEWIWEHPEDRIPEVENKVGLNQPGTWYGGIRTELPEGHLMEISYFDAETADSVKGIVYEDGDDEPGEKIGETETLIGQGDEEWTDITFEEPLEVDEGYYWVVLEVEDPGDGYQPFGVIEPYVEDAGYISFDGDLWDELPDQGLNYSWALEVNVVNIDRDGNNDNLISWEASEDDPGEVDHYKIYRSDDEEGPWNESTHIDEVVADGSAEYEYYDIGRGVPDDTTWWYVVRSVGINELEEDNENAVREVIPPEIMITSPEEDDLWYAETQEEITWETTEVENPIDHIDLEYTLDDGQNWEYIAEGIDDTGEYQWEIPEIVDHSEESQIRATVIDDTGTFDENVSEHFTIVGEPPESPERVIIEHSGEEGQDNLITWHESPDEEENLVEEYRIYRSEDREGPWDEEIAQVTADGSDRYEYLDEDMGDSDGIYWWYVVRAVDVYGQEEDNEDAKQEPGYPEADAPEISITQPDGGEKWFETTTQNILWDTEEGDEDIDYIDIWYSIDSGDEWIVIEKGLEDSGELEWEIPSEYSNESLVKGRVVDDAGRFDENISEDHFKILQDDSPPTLDINHPEEGEIISTDQITVDWQGTDDQSGISHYEIQLNEDGWIDVGQNESHEFEEVEDGEYIVEVKAVDNLGNEKIESVSFTVDTTPPEIIITSPEDGTAISEDSISILWAGNDATTDIVSYEIWSLQYQEFLDVGMRTWHEYSDLEDGIYTVEIRATDEAGNQETEDVTFTVDTEPPVVDITDPEADEIIEDDKVNVSWAGEYGTSGIEKYDIRLNDRGWVSYEAPEIPAEAGELIWEHDNHGGSVEAVFESDGVVYSGSDIGPGEPGEIIAYDAINGEELWRRYHHSGSIEDVHVADGVVYSGSFDGTVVATDADTGDMIWEHSLHGGGVNSVYVEDDVVFSGSSDGRVIAVDAEDGDEIWDHDHHDMPVFSVHVSDDVIYSTSIVNDLVIAADAEDGEYIWSHDHHEAMVYPVFEYEGIVYSADDGGWGQPGEVIAVDAEDGEFIWSHEHHEGTIYALHVWNDMVFTGSEDDTVIAADAEDGEFIWQHEHHDHIVRDLHVSDSVVYSAAEDDRVIATEAQDIEPDPLYHEFTDLEDGEHEVSVRAMDLAGNQHKETIEFTIQDPEPELNITKPTGALEELTYEEDIIIKGEIENVEKLEIDGKEVEIDGDTFSYETTLTEGLNHFIVVGEDDDGDRVERTVEALYLPEIPELLDSIEDIEVDIEDIDHNITYLKTELQVLEDDMSELDEDMSELDEDISDLEKEISTLESDIAALMDDISHLEDEISSLESEIDEVDQDIEDAQTQITTIENSIEYLEDEIEQLEGDLTQIYEEHDDQDDDITTGRNLAIVGMILGILAIIISIVVMNKENRSTEIFTAEKDEEEEIIQENDNTDEDFGQID